MNRILYIYATCGDLIKYFSPNRLFYDENSEINSEYDHFTVMPYYTLI